MIVFAFFYDSDDTVNQVIFLGFCGVAIVLALIATKLATDIHTNQLKHVHTLNKEKLLLINNKNFDDESEQIFETILSDITENSKPMYVFGITMRSEVLLGLRAIVFSVAMAYIFGG